MEARDALTKLFGGLLLAAGILLALSCGLCTGYFGIVSIASLFDPRNRGTIAFTAPLLLAGIVATAVGIGIAWSGLALLRRPPIAGEDRRPDRER